MIITCTKTVGCLLEIVGRVCSPWLGLATSKVTLDTSRNSFLKIKNLKSLTHCLRQKAVRTWMVHILKGTVIVIEDRMAFQS